MVPKENIFYQRGYKNECKLELFKLTSKMLSPSFSVTAAQQIQEKK